MCLGSFYLLFESRARRFGFFFYFKELPYHIIIIMKTVLYMFRPRFIVVALFTENSALRTAANQTLLRNRSYIIVCRLISHLPL